MSKQFVFVRFGRSRNVQFTIQVHWTLSPHAKNMNLELSQPKAKRFCSANATYNPFPVNKIGGEQKFTGIFTGLNVHIVDESSIQEIFTNGCFGVSSQTKANPRTQTTDPHVEVVSQLRYERKLEWMTKYSNQNPHNVRLKVVVNDVVPARNWINAETDTTNIMDDPFPIEDTLVLTLEEAFFLHFTLDCLRIVNLDQTLEFTTDEVIQKFCEHTNRFVERYVAYHYYRSRNWIVKSGIKFGGDFCKLAIFTFKLLLGMIVWCPTITIAFGLFFFH